MSSEVEVGATRPAAVVAGAVVVRALFLACAFLGVSGMQTAGAAAGDADTTGASLLDLPLEELGRVQVVYAASRYDQRASEAPVSVTIITADEIRAFGYRTVTEALQSVRGYYTTYDRNYSYTGVRGFGDPGDEDRRILLMVNGQRMNEPVFDSGVTGEQLSVPLEAVERIEVIRGPGSSIHGSNALQGAINIVTRMPSATAFSSMSVLSGSGRAGRAQALWSGPVGRGGGLLVSAKGMKSRGEDLYFAEFDQGGPDAGLAAGIDREAARGGFAALRWGRFRLDAGANLREKRIPTGSYGTVFGDDRSRTIDAQRFVAGAWSTSFADGREFEARLSAHEQNYEGEYVYEYDSGGGVERDLFRDNGRARWATASVQFTDRRLARQTLTMGAEHRRNFRADMDAWDRDGVYTRERRSSNTSGLFVQDDIQLARALHVHAGLRMDAYTSFGQTWNPRLAAVWSPSASAHLKALYGRAFRAPNTFELFYSGGGNKAAGSLDPERIETWELAFEHQASPNSWWTVSVFRNELRDLVSQYLDPADSLIVFRNDRSALAHGFEWEVQMRPRPDVRIVANGVHQRGEDGATGGELVNSPRTLAKLRVTMPFASRGSRIAIGGVGMSGRRTLQGGRVAPFARADISWSQSLLDDRVEFVLGASNVLDARYADPVAEQFARPSLEQDGRAWRATMVWRSR